MEELDPPVRQQVPVVQPNVETKPVVGLEETECNYVVMAFIAGVLFLAVSDSIRA